MTVFRQCNSIWRANNLFIKINIPSNENCTSKGDYLLPGERMPWMEYHVVRGAVVRHKETYKGKYNLLLHLACGGVNTMVIFSITCGYLISQLHFSCTRASKCEEANVPPQRSTVPMQLLRPWSYLQLFCSVELGQLPSDLQRQCRNRNHYKI